VKTTYTGAKLAELYMSRIVCLHGVPKKIVSDRGTQFTSHFWGKLHESLDTKLNFSSAYHPQTNGQTERTNQILKDMLRAYALKHGGSSDKSLPYAEFSYNNSPTHQQAHAAARLRQPAQPLYPPSAAAEQPACACAQPSKAVGPFPSAQPTSSAPHTAQPARRSVSPVPRPRSLTSGVHWSSLRRIVPRPDSSSSPTTPPTSESGRSTRPPRGSHAKESARDYLRLSSPPGPPTQDTRCLLCRISPKP
jgi:hypothetical protein